MPFPEVGDNGGTRRYRCLRDPAGKNQNGSCRAGRQWRFTARLGKNHARCVGQTLCTLTYYGTVSVTGCFQVCYSAGYSRAGGKHLFVGGSSFYGGIGVSAGFSPGQPRTDQGYTSGICYRVCVGGNRSSWYNGPTAPYLGAGIGRGPFAGRYVQRVWGGGTR